MNLSNIARDRQRFAVSRMLLTLTLALGGLRASSAHAAVPKASIAANVVGQGSYGSIKGRLVWGGGKAPAPAVLVATGTANKDPMVCAAAKDIVDHKLVVDPKTKGVKFGVAYLVRPSGTNPDLAKTLVEQAPKVVIDQVGCEFVPFLSVLHQDQTLVLKSSDPVNHNVHISPFTNVAFNMILPANGETEKKLVAERRAIPLVCDIHPWMKGYIMVFDHPFYAVTKDDGSFEIKGVPAGAQNLILWQAAVGYANPGVAKGMPVTVVADKTTDIGEIKLDPAKVK